ncbi:MAG: DUF1559 domain-containing protein [Pirellulales bacterium]
MADRKAFTLVELLVVISIIGVMVGLLLPAVQMAREAARRTQCSNNVKNIGLALHNFADAYRSFPAGNEGLKETYHAWSGRILPYIEQSPLYARIDFTRKWNEVGANADAAQVDVPVYRCPGSILPIAGKQDYGGILGTALLPLQLGSGPSDAFGCGVLISLTPEQSRPVRPGDVVDGLSCTMAVGESVDRNPESSGRWACGMNCFSQNEAMVNSGGSGELYSHHPNGAHALFADGHVRFIICQTEPRILGSICTRNGNELDAVKIEEN